ncbi:MAG: YCF48-related protein [Dehalococcoidia bacterium]
MAGATLFVLLAGALIWWFWPRAEGPRALATLDVEDVHTLIILPDSPDHALFGHHHGVLETRDGGRRWAPLAGNPGQDAMYLTSPTGGTSYIAGHEVFLRSHDGGVTWQPVQSNLPGLDIHAFAVHPTDPSRLYAYLVGHGLFASRDGGATWELRNPKQFSVVSIAIVPGEPDRLLLAAMGLAVFASSDDGRTLTPNTEGIFGLVFAVIVDPRNPQVVYAGASNGVYRSDDSGATWERIGLEGVSLSTLAISPTNPKVLMAVSRDKRVYRSEDGGRTW